MLQPTGRIELDKGIKFYEQDIIFDDYVYSNDLDITVNLEYATPGFGIALINSEGYSLKDKQSIILFRIGYKEATVIYRNGDTQKTLGAFSCPKVMTYKENMKYRLVKENNDYTLYVDDIQLFKCTVPYEMKIYNLGYYSNANNSIKNISIASAIPYGWIVNMQNTQHGYINFEKDGFKIYNCNENAELEQVNIYLKPDTYYLKYESNSIDDKYDLTPYICLSEDTRLFDEEKNILSYADNSFTIKYPTMVNLKFKGTSGQIKKLQITSQKDNEYIRTSPDKGDYIDIGGSYITVRLTQLESLSLDAVINGTPNDRHNSPYEYAIISDGTKNYGLFDLDIAIKKKYSFFYNVKNKKLTIKDGEIKIKEIYISNAKYILTLFHNVNAVVENFKIKTIDGKDFDIVVQNTTKKYVPGSIKSPIIVTNKYDLPLNLSSSYRVYNNNGFDFYQFTNIEREVFEPKHILNLSSIPSKKEGSIIVFGIRKNATVNKDKIMHIGAKNMFNSIDSYSNMYDILFEKDLRSIDKDNAEIRLSDLKDYKEIVVDYLKRDSYAINYEYELNTYEVDISIEDNDEAYVIYDNTEKAIFNSDKLLINSNDYIETDIIPNDNCYIIIGGDYN